MIGWSTLKIARSSQAPIAELVVLDESGTLVAGAPEIRQRAADAARRVSFTPRLGSAFDITPADDHQGRILVLGAGNRQRPPDHLWTTLGGALPKAMASARVTTLRVPQGLNLSQRRELCLGALLHDYRFEGLKSYEGESPRSRTLVFPDGAEELEEAQRIANVALTARAWVDAPANLLNPETFAAEALALKEFGLDVRIIDAEALKAMGAGAILAVGRGAEHAPRLAIAEWRGAEHPGWDAVLVGKGLTFDGGGLNLKARPIIEKMRFDMAGGAAVLGAVALAASRGARVNVAAIVPMVENAIDAMAYRPGDVITSLSGATIEVADTDAEGRLVLADSLTFGLRQYAPTTIVDVATLTGALTAVLHEEFGGVFTSDDALADELDLAGRRTGERVWRLPLDPRQTYLVESKVADVRNFGAPGHLGLSSGSPAAGAQFLWRFVDASARWAHIDIAGAAWATRPTPLAEEGATGFGAILLDRWLAGLEDPGGRSETLEARQKQPR